MQFLKKSIPVTVFRVDNPENITAGKLKQHAFQSIDDLKTEVKAQGWVNIDDMLDTSWSVSPPEKGNFLCFSFRTDTRKVPPALLNKHLDLALKEELEKMRGEGREFVSRARKKELKEQVSFKLLVTIPAVPSAVDCALDTSSGLLYVGSASTSVLEQIQERCQSNFAVTLLELNRGGLEESSLPDDVLVCFLRSVHDGSLNGRFEGVRYTLSDMDEMTLSNADGRSVTVKKTVEGVAPCLEAGLNIQKMKLLLEDNGATQWHMVLGVDFRFSVLQCPVTDSAGDEGGSGKEDADAALLERLYLVGQAIGAVHAIFQDFAQA